MIKIRDKAGDGGGNLLEPKFGPHPLLFLDLNAWDLGHVHEEDRAE